jgi:carbon monoxide dehydrogenase subunit G
MSAGVQSGYLLIADITGFTAFLADSELEHGQAVLVQILQVLIDNLAAAMTLVEVEGDAVFVYLPDAACSRGEWLAELIETTYTEFRDLRQTMVRNATCPCRACASIPGLDLKFVVHHGVFVVQTLAGKTGPVGNDVILVHRLLKNRLGDETGWSGYALYTRQALDRIGLTGEGRYALEATYEHLGVVHAWGEDLGARYQTLRGARRVYLDETEADAALSHDFQQPRALVWDWLNDPDKRNRWIDTAGWTRASRVAGRVAAGATNHCSSFDVVEQILDWRPFDYYTVRFNGGWVAVTATVTLEELGPGTRVRWRMRMEKRLPRALRRLFTRALLERRMRLRENFIVMDQLMHDAVTVGSTPADPGG